jgi:hypothetical protein
MCNAFDGCSVHYKGKWKEVGPWKSRLFRALLNAIKLIGECHLGPKNHRCIGGFMYKSPRIVSGPIPPPVQLSNITALLPPHPPHIQNLLEINRKL